jgi:ClpP class serine protease
VGLEQRIPLYKQLEDHRKKPLIVYVTSTRENAPGQIGSDAIAELLTQLEALPSAAQDLDFLVVSNGGDGTVAWRIVSLIRERVKHFSILIPQGAFSAATLLALGANRIVMHPHGNLGPTDPQITNRKKNIAFGSEDVQSFLRFAREDVGLTDQEHLRELFLKFSEEIGFTALGVAART